MKVKPVPSHKQREMWASRGKGKRPHTSDQHGYSGSPDTPSPRHTQLPCAEGT